MAQRATGQRLPLLQVETVRFMLPDCLWKRKWNVTSFCWKAKLGTLHTEKNYLLALFTFVRGAKGDRATSPSFASRNGSIHASRLSLEAQMERNFILLEGEARHFAHGKITCLQFFLLFMAQRATRQRRPLLYLKTQRLMLPDRRWKPSVQHSKCIRPRNGSTLPTANKTPVCRSLIVYKQRGRRGNVALFCI